MPDTAGRILKGERISPSTEFKKGQHWRPYQVFRDKEWLLENYISKQRTLADIAGEFGVTDSAVQFWIARHGLQITPMRVNASRVPAKKPRNEPAKRSPRPSLRPAKRADISGSKNPMFGRTGSLNPNWKGGVTPLRQAMYASSHWKRLKREVRRRDPICVRCGSSNQLEYHHIIPFAKAPLLGLEVSNVCRVCCLCHKKMLGNETRYAARLQQIIARKEVSLSIRQALKS